VNAKAFRSEFNRYKGRRTAGHLMGAIGVASAKADDDPGIALPVSPRDEWVRVWK
jgi:hypothetical protein